MSGALPPRIGRYEVLGLLGTGGMAEIFLAKQPGPQGFERPVVVKRVLPHLARQREFRDMFVDEAHIVSRIHHPNIVSVHELGDDRDALFMVMEYLEGENLATLLKSLRRAERPLPLRLAAHVASEALAGLHAAHELADPQGIKLDVVHRDVSPQNLFVLYAGQVKVIDFGIAKSIDRKAGRTQTGQVKGKFAYMAPEQITAERVDRRTDVFAVGVVLHELITGAKLFARDHDLLVLKAICEEPIALPSAVRADVPKELDDVVMKALARDPEKRYPTAAAMRRDLMLALRALPGDDLPEEALASLMADLFQARIAGKLEMLRRVRSGLAIEQVPAAEPTGSDVTAPTKAESPSKTGAATPGQALSVPPSAPRGRRWPVAVAGLVVAVPLAVFAGTKLRSPPAAAHDLPPSSGASTASPPAVAQREPEAATAAPAAASAPATAEASQAQSAAPTASVSSSPKKPAAQPLVPQPPPAKPTTKPVPAPATAAPTSGFTRFD